MAGYHFVMDALGLTVNFHTQSCALSHTFLNILCLEAKGMKVKVSIELRPLNDRNVFSVRVQWETLSTIEIYRLIQNSLHEYRVVQINIECY